MTKYVLPVIILLSLLGCKGKKTAAVVQHAETNEFYELYNKLPLPYSVADSNLSVTADTNSISYPVFTQFVPDSIFNNFFGENRRLSIHPVGKIEQKGKENYFVTLISDKSISVIYLLVFVKNKFVVSMPLVAGDNDDIINSASIDKKLSIVIEKRWTVKNDPFYKRTIFAYNNAGVFTTVLTETNEDRSAGKSIVNPLDTFPKKNKYSGDYVKSNKNVLFIRDSKTPGQYLFYVHFETEDKDEPCGGELKGFFKMVTEKAGVYTGTSDPCVLNLTFKGNAVKVNETGSCGNYRGIKCFFNDTYTKKASPKTPVKRNTR